MREFIAKHKKRLQECSAASTGWCSRDAAVDQLCERDDELSVGHQVRLTEFGRYAQRVSDRVKQRARPGGSFRAPVKYLASAERVRKRWRERLRHGKRFRKGWCVC